MIETHLRGKLSVGQASPPAMDATEDGGEAGGDAHRTIN